jgi:hypothetical protein
MGIPAIPAHPWRIGTRWRCATPYRSGTPYLTGSPSSRQGLEPLEEVAEPNPLWGEWRAWGRKKAAAAAP